MENSMTFATEFWNNTPGTISGHSILIEKMKLGSTVFERYMDFSKQMADVIEAFGKALTKTAKENPLIQETGYLLQTGCILTNSFRQLGQDCKDAAEEIMKQVRLTLDQYEEYYEVRKNYRETMRRKNNTVIENMRRVENAKKQIKNEVLIQNENENSPERKSSCGSIFEKLRLTKEIGLSEAEKQYENSVDEINKSIDEFKEEANKQFKWMQIYETNRREHLKESIWLTCNILSQLATEFDKAMEFIRESLKYFDVEKDIQLWIGNNRTGQSPPEHVECIPSKEIVSPVECQDVTPTTTEPHQCISD